MSVQVTIIEELVVGYETTLKSCRMFNANGECVWGGSVEDTCRGPTAHLVRTDVQAAVLTPDRVLALCR